METGGSCQIFGEQGESDIAAITLVINEAFEVERAFRIAERTSEHEVRRLSNEGEFLLAFVDASLSGVVFMRVDGLTGYFGMLAVSPHRQRLRIGRVLIESAEDYCRARGCTSITLSTGSVREELVQYYQRLGYTITSIEPGPDDGTFTIPFDVVKMTKML